MEVLVHAAVGNPVVGKLVVGKLVVGKLVVGKLTQVIDVSANRKRNRSISEVYLYFITEPSLGKKFAGRENSSLHSQSSVRSMRQRWPPAGRFLCFVFSVPPRVFRVGASF